MTKVYILLAIGLCQAAPLSAQTLMQQQLWQTDGECHSALQTSKHLVIGKKARQSPPVSMRGVLIQQVRTHKHLGLVLNESLTWSDHISSVHVYTACARMIGIMRRLDGAIRSPALKRIYTAVIRPRLEYACAVWSGGPTGCLQRLQDSCA